MDTSIFIAKIFGTAYLIVGLGVLINHKFYKKMFDSFLKELGTMYLGGLMALVAGLAIVLTHNVWEGWPILITVFGWLALLKGFWILVFPEFMMKVSNGMIKKMCFCWIGVFAMIMGAILCYFGFFM